MKIARIVKSNSHVDYVARILDRLETAEPPAPEHYGFGQFVVVDTNQSKTIGVIYNSQLINPEYGRLGPRLSSSQSMNEVFSPDLVDEQGVLVGVLLLGWIDADAQNHHAIPRQVIAANSEIILMTDEEVRAFHQGRNGRLMLRYYPQVTTHAGQLAPQLLLAVLDQLEMLFAGAKSEIAVLRRSLNWQQVFQSKSL